VETDQAARLTNAFETVDDKHVIPDARGASDPESILNVQSQDGRSH
jgi:hypothetical protein